MKRAKGSALPGGRGEKSGATSSQSPGYPVSGMGAFGTRYWLKRPRNCLSTTSRKVFHYFGGTEDGARLAGLAFALALLRSLSVRTRHCEI